MSHDFTAKRRAALLEDDARRSAHARVYPGLGYDHEAGESALQYVLAEGLAHCAEDGSVIFDQAPDLTVPDEPEAN